MKKNEDNKEKKTNSKENAYRNVHHRISKSKPPTHQMNENLQIHQGNV